MVFNRRWDPLIEDYKIDRTLTGPPPPPETGTVVEASGIVVADSAEVSIPPATPIRVTFPGPRERLVDARGIMTPRWRRFFEELWRRTGGVEDNINNADRFIQGSSSSTTGTLTITGNAPTILLIPTPSIGSLTISSEAPTVTVA